MTVRARITQLVCYPIKSLGAVDLKASVVGAEGLVWDRRWMLVDAAGHFITQRQLPALASIRVRIFAHELQLVGPEGRRWHVPLTPPNGALVPTKVHGHPCFGVDEGDAISEWLEDILGDKWNRGIRLVRFAADHQLFVEHQRRIGEKRLAEAKLNNVEAHTGFADGYPLLVASEDSLEEVNSALEDNGHQRVEMSRFRPNIVVKGLEAFGEHDYPWIHHVSSGLLLWAGKPCERCPVTKIDQTSGEIMDPLEPLSLLKSLGPFEGTAIFGVNAIPMRRTDTRIQIGEELEFSSTPPAGFDLVD